MPPTEVPSGTGAELHCRLAPGVSATLFAADRLEQLQGEFTASGGQGEIAPPGSCLLLLWRDPARLPDGFQLALEGLTVESSTQAWDLRLVTQVGWDDREANGVAMVAPIGFARVAGEAWEGSGLVLYGPGHEHLAQLPMGWLAVLSATTDEGVG